MTSKTWYPTCRVQLVLRVDTTEEGSSFLSPENVPEDSTSGAVAQAANDPEGSLRKNREERDNILGNREKIAPDVFERRIANNTRERRNIYAAASSGAEEGLTTDENVIKFWVIPTKVNIERNNLSDAGKCTVSLDYADLPFDPRGFRFAAVRVVIGDVTPEDYAAGITLGGNPNRIPSIVGIEKTRWYSLTGNARFVGFVDEWTVDFGEDGDTVELQCRDLSSVLRDEQLPLSEGIDLDEPIDKGVRNVLKKFVSMKEIRVLYANPVFQVDDEEAVRLIEEGSTAPSPRGAVEGLKGRDTNASAGLLRRLKERGINPTNSNGDPVKIIPETKGGLVSNDLVERASKSGAEKKKSSRKKVARSKSDQTTKVWEHIMDVCFKMGLLPIMRGNILFIASPRDVYSGLYGRRQMIWGGNISRLKFARKAGSSDAIGKSIQIIAPDAATGRQLWARYPVKPGEPSSGILGAEGSPQPVNTRATIETEAPEAQDSFITYSLGGVRNGERLAEIAESVFQRVSRQEIAVSFETNDLSSFTSDERQNQPDGSAESSDLLAIQSGDSVIIETIRTASTTAAQFLHEGTNYRPNNFLDLAAMSMPGRAKYLTDIGFNAEVAKLIASSIELGDYQRTFRVNHASISWDGDEGVTISVDAINFIEAKIEQFENEDTSALDNLQNRDVLAVDEDEVPDIDSL